eukprot:g257.t1
MGEEDEEEAAHLLHVPVSAASYGTVEKFEGEDDQRDEELTAKRGDGKKWISVFEATMLLTNSCIGAGVLSFPFAFRCMGWLLGSVVCILFALILAFTAYVLIVALEIIQIKSPSTRSFHQMCSHIGGPVAGAFLEAVLFLYLFGICSSFMVILGDVAPILIQDMLFAVTGSENAGQNVNRTNVVVFASLSLLPIAMSRTMRALRWTSMVGVIGALSVAITMFVELVYQQETTISSAARTESDYVPIVYSLGGIFQSVPLLCFGLGCHINIPMVYVEMAPNSRNSRSFLRVIVLTFCTCLFVYMSIGLMGYFIFGSATPGDVLAIPSDAGLEAGFSKYDKLANTGRFAVLGVALCGYPLCHTPARASLASLLRRVNLIEPLSKSGLSTAFIVVEALLFTTATAYIGVECVHLQIVFDVFGAMMGSIEVLMIPASFLVVYGVGSTHRYSRAERATSAVLILLGVAIAYFGTKGAILGSS